MAGGGNRIMEEDYTTMIKDMLTNYKDKEIQLRIFGTKEEQQDFLTHCVACLESYERDLITNILIEKISIRRYARKTGFSRSFITKERDRIISLLAKFFQIRYSYVEERQCAG